MTLTVSAKPSKTWWAAELVFDNAEYPDASDGSCDIRVVPIEGGRPRTLRLERCLRSALASLHTTTP
jgi:hypothetical protein